MRRPSQPWASWLWRSRQEPQDLAAQGAYKEVNAAGLRNVIETLIAQDPVSGEIKGVLATGWERIDDKTVRFHDTSKRKLP